jgi:hypothetical protein
VAAADDEVVLIEIEELDGGREKGQVLAVVTARPWEHLRKRSDDSTPLDCRRYRPWYPNQRVQSRIRIELAERLEHLLPAPHPRQPIVDDGDAGTGGWQQRRRVDRHVERISW